jgi:hypothetical protein
VALKSLSTRPLQTTLTTVYAQTEAPLQTSTDLYRPLQASETDDSHDLLYLI